MLVRLGYDNYTLFSSAFILSPAQLLGRAVSEGMSCLLANSAHFWVSLLLVSDDGR